MEATPLSASCIRCLLTCLCLLMPFHMFDTEPWNHTGHECVTLLFLVLSQNSCLHDAKVAENSVYDHNMQVIIEIVFLTTV